MLSPSNDRSTNVYVKIAVPVQIINMVFWEY